MSLPNPIVLLDARAKYVHPAFQMTRASTETVFDSAGRLVTVPANALGWDHDPATGQARGYLVEPSATNLLTDSNDLTGAWSNFQAVVTGNAITGPDGNGMAKITETVSSGQHTVYQSFTITDGSPVALQCIARAGERSNVELRLQQASNNTNFVRMVANLLDGTGATGGGGSGIVAGGAVKYLGGGFYHISVWGELGSGITDARLVLAMRDENNTLTYDGDGTSGLYVGYCQAEEAHFRMDGPAPTSYIETSGATATRAEGQLLLPSIDTANWWNPNGGTILLDWYRKSVMRNGMHWAIAGDFWLRESGNAGAVQLQVAGAMSDTTATLLTPHQFDIEARYLAAVAWDAEDFSASVNGGSVATGNMTGNPSGHLRVGWFNVSWSNPPHADFARLVYYPQRISNADLQSLTAIQE